MLALHDKLDMLINPKISRSESDREEEKKNNHLTTSGIMTENKNNWIRVLNTGFFQFKECKNGRECFDIYFHITNMPQMHLNRRYVRVRNGGEFIEVFCEHPKRDFKDIRTELDRFYRVYMQKVSFHTMLHVAQEEEEENEDEKTNMSTRKRRRRKRHKSQN